MQCRNKLVGFLIIAAIVGGARLAVAADGPQLKLIQTIPLPNVQGRIDHMAIDEKGHRLFVAALGNDSLEVIDLQAGKVEKHIADLAEPQGVAYIPESGKLVVASGGGGNVRIYDSEFKLIGKIDKLDDADNVRYDAKARLVYVGYGNGALGVIDPEKIAKVADIPLDGHPESFRLEEKGARIFVNVPHSDEIEVIDREKREVIAKWPLKSAKSNFPMFLEEERHRLFVGCRHPAKILVFDAQTGTSVAEFECVKDTDDLYFDPSAKTLYVSGGGGAITIIQQKDGDHFVPLDAVDTEKGARTSLFSFDTHRLYVAVPLQGNHGAEIRVYESATVNKP